MKRNKILAVMMIMIGIVGFQIQSVAAVENIPTQTVNKIGEETSKTSSGTTSSSSNHTYANGYLELDENGNVVGNPADTYLPKTSIDEVNTKVTSKANDVIGALQNFGLPACIIFFILAAIYTVAGSIVKKGALGKGLIAMGICIVVYACISYAPAIVNYVAGWLAS